MKRFAGWLLFFWGCICCICASEISITDSWKYKAENDERFSSMDWNDSDWVTVDLPHTWNAGHQAFEKAYSYEIVPKGSLMEEKPHSLI